MLVMVRGGGRGGNVTGWAEIEANIFFYVEGLGGRFD